MDSKGQDLVLYGIVTAVLAALILFFWQAQSRLEHATVTPSAAILNEAAGSAGLTFEVLQLQVAQMRYRQAGLALYTQSARRSAGLLLGSLLAMIGALFIVRRIRLTGNTLDVQTDAGLKASLVSSSPGVVLAFLGVSVIIAALVVRDTVQLRDDLATLAPTGAAAVTRNQSIPSPDSIAAARARLQDAYDALERSRR